MTDKPTPTTDLLKRCAEIHEWRSTGVLSGEALRDYAKRKWPDRHDTLQMAEHETVTEALALLAKWGRPAAEPSRFGSPELQAMIIARCVEKDQADSGFDYKTAADILSGKTVSDEAVRKFVAASRWAHDERAALSATLLAMHGVLTSREAEIALLKQALLEAESAPQPAPLSEREAFEAWIEKDGGDLGTFGTPPNMHYRNSAVNNAWVAWKARAALAAQGGSK